MEDIEIIQKKNIGALYIEDLIDFFMKNNMINWQRPYRISEFLRGVPVLFSQEIGRAAFVISHIYEYRQMVQVSELRECLDSTDKFYKHVCSRAWEFLSGHPADFFHISAYAGEVAVFCQRENVPHLQQKLILTILDLLTCCARLNLETTRSYFQNLANGLDKARIDRVFSEVHETLADQSSQDEHFISNPQEFSEENSSDNHQYIVSGIVGQPNDAVDLENNIPQVQSLVQPDASFSQATSYSPLPETMASGFTYPNLIGAHCIPASNSAQVLDYPYHQRIPEFFPSAVAPSVVYSSTANSEFDESHVSSSAEASELTSSFSTVNASNSTEHTPTDNSNSNTSTFKCPECNSARKSHTLNVNAPVFVPSSQKSMVDSFRNETGETLKSRKCKNPENTILSSNNTQPE